MYKKILAPLDGSKFSECALEHVIAIVTGCNVPEVDLLFVVEEILGMASTTYAVSLRGQERLKAWGKDYLNKIVEGLGKEGVTAKGIVFEGENIQHEEVNRSVEDGDEIFPLIVVGGG